MTTKVPIEIKSSSKEKGETTLKIWIQDENEDETKTKNNSTITPSSQKDIIVPKKSIIIENISSRKTKTMGILRKFQIKQIEQTDSKEEISHLRNINPNILEYILDFVPNKDRAHLYSLSSYFNKILDIIPLDLSEFNITTEQFFRFFYERRQNANLSALTLMFESGDEFELNILNPFLTKIKRLFILAKKQGTIIDLSPLEKAFSLTTLCVNTHTLDSNRISS